MYEAFSAPAVSGLMQGLPAHGSLYMQREVSPCAQLDTRETANFEGEVRHANTFERSFGPGFLFKLTPTEKGWRIQVFREGAEDFEGDLARLTPPLRGPNA